MATITARMKHARVGVLAVLTGTSPSAWSWQITEVDRILSGYAPRLALQGDTVSDDGGSVRTSISILQKGPHRLTVGGATQVYRSASHAAQAVTLIGATVALTRRFVGGAGSIEDVALLTGKVVQITHASASAITLEIELRAEIDEAPAPKTKIQKGEGFTDAAIPSESIGSFVPFCLGKFARPLGSNFGGENAQAWRRSYFLFRPNVTPMVEVRRLATSTYYAFADYAGVGDLKIGDPTDTTNVGAQAAYQYVSEIDEYAYVWHEGTNIQWGGATSPYLNKCWIASIPTRPWMLLGVRPTEVNVNLGVLNPERAIDGEMFTYATLAPGTHVYYDVPRVPAQGRISQNSTANGTGPYDHEGVNAPPGISVVVVLCAPPGEVIASGSISIEVVFPRTGDKLFAHTTKTMAIPTVVGAGSQDWLVLPYCDQTDGSVSAATDGWGGTKFHNYHFTSSPVSGGQDVPLQGTGANVGKDEPFRIKLSHASGTGKAYIAGVWWGVGYKAGIQSYQPRVSKRRAVVGHVDGDYGRSRNRYSSSRYVDYYGDIETPAQREVRIPTGAGWKTIRKASAAVLRTTAESPSGFYASSGGRADDVSGTYTGTAGKLITNPADMAHYLLKGKYGNQASAVTALGSFGSFANARNNLNSWAAINSLAAYECDLAIADESTVDQILRALSIVAPSMLVRVRRTGAWAAHCWYPSAATWAHDQYGTTIDARKHVLPGAEGPDIEINWTDGTQVVNKLTIEYGWDAGRGKALYTARCSKDDYNDGQGGNWPVWPGGADPADVCAWSYARFQIERAREIRLHEIRDGRMAAVIGSILLAMGYRETPVLRMRCSSALADMEVGHVFKLDRASMEVFGFYSGLPGLSWDQIEWRCIRSEGRGDAGVTQYIEALWQPGTIGGEIAGFAPVDEGGAM